MSYISKITEKIEKVDLSKIDFTDESHRFTDRHYRWDLLEESIRSSGVLSPPILQQKNALFRIIIGFKRLEVARRLGYKKITSWIVPERVDAKDLFRLSIEEKMAHREMSLLEKSKALSCLVKSGVGEEAVIHDFMPLLDLNPSHRLKEQLLNLIRLPDEIQSYIVIKKLPLRRIGHLEQMKDDELKIISYIIKNLLPSPSNFEVITKGLLEIARREGESVNVTIDRIGIKKTIEDKNLSSEEKPSTIRKILKENRYPILTAINRDIETEIVELSMPKHMKIEWDRELERSGFTLKVDIRDGAQLEMLIRCLRDKSLFEALQRTLETMEKNDL